MTPAPGYAIQLADGVVNVQLNCTQCSNYAWSHQQVAWLAEAIAIEVSRLTAGKHAQPPSAATAQSNAMSISPPGSPREATSDLVRLQDTLQEDSSSVAAAVTPAVSLGKKGPRTRTGCFTCRMKRVKCDEKKPACTRCMRNPDRQCVYPKRLAVSLPHALPGVKQPAVQAPRSAVTRYQPRPTVPSASLNSPTVGGSGTVSQAVAQDNTLPDQFGLFLDGLALISSPGLLHFQPNKREGRARSDRVLAKLWEAQMIMSVSGRDLPPVSQQVKLADALVSVAWSLGAVKRAFSGTVPTAVHDVMLARSRNFVEDAAALIHAYNRGDGFDSPETFLVLLELLLLRDCASGDPLWANTHKLLTTYVKRRGGPKVMVEEARASILGIGLLEHHLVYLTLYDTFASLSRNLEPYLLAPGQWRWLEEVPCAQEVIQSDFGISLQMLFYVAELATLLANRGAPQTPVGTAQYQQACEAMYEALETVALATIYSTPSSIRVQFGDLLIRHSLICHLQCVAFGRRRDDPIIQRSASAIIELLAEVAVRTGSMANLMYPLLIAAGLSDAGDHERLQLLIDFTKVSTGLVEFDRMEKIVHECWRRRAAGEGELEMTDIWSANCRMLIL